MPVDRRPFRIEADIASDDRERELRAASEQGVYTALFERIFDELADIRQLVQRDSAPQMTAGAGSAEMMAEIESIQRAISQTKREILSLQIKGLRRGFCKPRP